MCFSATALHNWHALSCQEMEDKAKHFFLHSKPSQLYWCAIKQRVLLPIQLFSVKSCLCRETHRYNSPLTHLETHYAYWVTHTQVLEKKDSSSHSWSPSAWCCVCPKGLKGSMFACWTIVKSPTDMSSLLLCRAALFSAGGDLCEWEGNALIWWMSAYLWEYWWPMCSLVWEVIFVARTWQQSF